MNSTTNITSNILVPGTYECATQSIKESPQEILCLEGGIITFWPIKGDKFIWNASSGKKIKLIPKKSNNNDILSVALYKNETIRLQDIDVRTTTSTQPYPFAFNGINNINPDDKFDIRISCANANTRTAILRTLMFAITT
jgi:hypothetical protein